MLLLLDMRAGNEGKYKTIKVCSGFKSYLILVILTTLLYTFPQSIDIAGGLDPSSYYFISSQRREADDERRSLSGRGGSKSTSC